MPVDRLFREKMGEILFYLHHRDNRYKIEALFLSYLSLLSSYIVNLHFVDGERPSSDCDAIWFCPRLLNMVMERKLGAHYTAHNSK